MKTLKIQEVKVSFEVDKKQYQLLIKRDNRRQCIYMVSAENTTVKEGKVQKANPSNCLNDVLKDNNYLRYCDIRTA